MPSVISLGDLLLDAIGFLFTDGFTSRVLACQPFTGFVIGGLDVVTAISKAKSLNLNRSIDLIFLYSGANTSQQTLYIKIQSHNKSTRDSIAVFPIRSPIALA